MLAGARRLHRLSLLFASTTICTACALTRTPSSTPTAPVHEFATTTTLHGKRLDLHVAVPAILARDKLFVVYASGDGGWFGTAIDQWREIAKAGYASVGFSSRAFLRIERPAEASLNSVRLAAEYEQIVEDAQRALGWGESPRIILAGWSRGASFAVLTGTEPPLRGMLAGVVAIGLPEGEDLKIDGDGDDTDDGGASTTGRRWPFDTYARLMQLPAPCAVIQATHDNYFAAADARRRFGPDTATRRFYQVEARNHRFSGGTATFNSALKDALNWVSSGSGENTDGLHSGSKPVGRGLE